MVPGFGDLVRHRARADHDQVIHESMFALEQSQRGGQLRLCSASGVGESFEKEIALGPAGDAGGTVGCVSAIATEMEPMLPLVI